MFNLNMCWGKKHLLIKFVKLHFILIYLWFPLAHLWKRERHRSRFTLKKIFLFFIFFLFLRHQLLFFRFHFYSSAFIFFSADQTAVTRNFSFRRSTRANKLLFVLTLSRSSFVDTCTRWHACARKSTYAYACKPTSSRDICISSGKRMMTFRPEDIQNHNVISRGCQSNILRFFFHLFCFAAFARLVVVLSCVDGANGIINTTRFNVLSIAELHISIILTVILTFDTLCVCKIKIKNWFSKNFHCAFASLTNRNSKSMTFSHLVWQTRAASLNPLLSYATNSSTDRR